VAYAGMAACSRTAGHFVAGISGRAGAGIGGRSDENTQRERVIRLHVVVQDVAGHAAERGEGALMATDQRGHFHVGNELDMPARL
jgi:hypothetical protein